MKKLIEVLAAALVEEPDQLLVEEKKSSRSSIYTMLVAAPDAGKLIGRKGRTIKALRQVVRAVAVHQGKRVDLEVLAHGEAAGGTLRHSQDRGGAGE